METNSGWGDINGQCIWIGSIHLFKLVLKNEKHNDDDVSLVLEFWSHDNAYDVPYLVSKGMKMVNEAVNSVVKESEREKRELMYKNRIR